MPKENELEHSSPWVVFKRSQTLHLKRNFNIHVPTLAGPTTWSDEFYQCGYRIQKSHVTGHHRVLNGADFRVFWGTYDECMNELNLRLQIEPKVPEREHLVLCLHGIFRSKRSMHPMQNHLRDCGFEGAAINYPSTLRSIEEHAQQIARLLSRNKQYSRVSFVCHSMGGLVVRALLADRSATWRKSITPSRLVMIATPNQGAFLADELSKTWAFRAIAGPAGKQLTAEWVANLPTPDIEFGVIAGGKGDGKGFNPILKGDDDLTVSVESTLLDGYSDFLRVPAIHTFIIRKPAVLAATGKFITSGRFASPNE